MAKKETRISITKLESIQKEKTVTVPLEGTDDTNIVIRRSLPISEMMQFVEDVVSSVVDVDGGRYLPEIKAFVIKSHVLTSYANFNMPSNLEKQYDLIYNTTAVEQVLENINIVQYNEMIDAIDRKIAHNLTIISNTMAEQIRKMITTMEEFTKNSEKLFGNITGEEMSSIIQNLSSIGDMDENKLVHAVFEEQKKRDASTVLTETAENENQSTENIVVFPKSKN